eukprot:m.86190 g.86190  ORF g.86190 m.86190 type:complete len:188 (-) comp9659_c0_seq1:134-697(-)
MAEPVASTVQPASPSTLQDEDGLQHHGHVALPSNPRLPNGTFFWHSEPPVLEGGPALLSVAEVMSGSDELASIRLYYRPQDTPHGRTWRHGDDEVLASRRQRSLSIDDAVQMMEANTTHGNVGVVSYRDYTRAKAVQARRMLASPEGPPLQGELPEGTVWFFVREDYRDPMLEARDHVAAAYDDIDI